MLRLCRKGCGARIRGARVAEPREESVTPPGPQVAGDRFTEDQISTLRALTKFKLFDVRRKQKIMEMIENPEIAEDFMCPPQEVIDAYILAREREEQRVVIDARDGEMRKAGASYVTKEQRHELSDFSIDTLFPAEWREMAGKSLRLNSKSAAKLIEKFRNFYLNYWQKVKEPSDISGVPSYEVASMLNKGRIVCSRCLDFWFRGRSHEIRQVGWSSYEEGGETRYSCRGCSAKQEN